MRSIADHVYDIVINSIKADGKNIVLELTLDETEKYFKFRVKDDGHGIEKEKLDKIFDPFYTTRDKKIRRVGLGLPFLKHNAELAKGYVKIESEFGKGTTLEALFKTSSFDIPEMGDIASSVAGLLTYSNEVNWSIIFNKNDKRESITTLEIKEILGDIPVNDINVIPVIGDIVRGIVSGLEFKY